MVTLSAAVRAASLRRDRQAPVNPPGSSRGREFAWLHRAGRSHVDATTFAGVGVCAGVVARRGRFARAGRVAEPDHHLHRALRRRRLYRPRRPAGRHVTSKRRWARPVIIDDRAGAGGIVGTQAVANAAPDGYTFCVCSIGAISIAPFVQKVGYDPVTRPRADRHRELDRAGGHRQEGPAGEDDCRARGLRQGPSRQAQLRLQRRRRPHPLFGRAVPDAHRNDAPCTFPSRAARSRRRR